MEKDIAKLLSGLWTDANMALDDDWDRSDSGFKAQITLIEEFASKYDIDLTDTRTES